MLTYHLVKVAHWIRSGGIAPELAPDRWDGYEYFPYGGDALWAWAMLPFHGDAPLAAASVLIWLAALISAYAGGIALAALGAVGLVALVRRGSPGIAAFLAAEAALTLALLFSPDALALRTGWASLIGRFMLPALGVCAVTAAATNHAAVRAGLGLAALLGLWGALPHGFSREDFSATAEVAGVLTAGAALAWIAASLAARRGGATTGALAATAILLVAGALWGAIRALAPPLIWRAAYEQRAFELLRGVADCPLLLSHLPSAPTASTRRSGSAGRQRAPGWHGRPSPLRPEDGQTHSAIDIMVLHDDD
jgi:hypothetical protein